MKKTCARNQDDSILEAIYNRYRADPEGFRRYLPEIADRLEQQSLPGARGNHRSVLTEPERERLASSLSELLSRKQLNPEQAIQALEHCATLIRDESLPDQLDRKKLIEILRVAKDINLSKITRTTRIEVRQGEEAREIAVLRGVHLHLTWNDRVLAVSVIPSEMKERNKLLRLVGIARDKASDVAARHDDYLAEVSPHGV